MIATADPVHDLGITSRLGVIVVSSIRHGFGVGARVYMVGRRRPGAEPKEVKIDECEHYFAPGSDGEAMMRSYMGGECPWFILADWLEDHADSLTTLPEYLRPRVGLAFREYHESQL